MTQAQIPEGSVFITPSQMYAQQVETTAAVRRLEGKVDMLVTQLSERDNEKDRVHSDHESRIRELERHGTADHDQRITDVERKVWKAVGVVGVLGAGCSGAIVAIFQALGH
jgi:Na+/phosphate symporter